MNEDAALLSSPHIIVVIVIQLDIIPERWMPILVVARAVGATVLVAVLAISAMVLVAIAWIVVVVVHGFIICAVPVLLFLCLQHRSLSVTWPLLDSGNSTYLLISLILKVLIWLLLP